jgi:hypothetical protein
MRGGSSTSSWSSMKLTNTSTALLVSIYAMRFNLSEAGSREMSAECLRSLYDVRCLGWNDRAAANVG